MGSFEVWGEVMLGSLDAERAVLLWLGIGQDRRRVKGE
jgi:hypothetical protein